MAVSVPPHLASNSKLTSWEMSCYAWPLLRCAVPTAVTAAPLPSSSQPTHLWTPQQQNMNFKLYSLRCHVLYIHCNESIFNSYCLLWQKSGLSSTPTLVWVGENLSSLGHRVDHTWLATNGYLCMMTLDTTSLLQPWARRWLLHFSNLFNTTQN